MLKMANKAFIVIITIIPLIKSVPLNRRCHSLLFAERSVQCLISTRLSSEDARPDSVAALAAAVWMTSEKTAASVPGK